MQNPAIDSHSDFDQHEKVVFCESDSLTAIIAVHNTNLGPATGGCRIFPYASTEAALTDVLRLSRGMTYKSALASVAFGGGKSVIIADPGKDKSDDLLHAFGDFVDSFAGQYIAAEDSGTTVIDIARMAERTNHVLGCQSNEQFGGDPSPVTAQGVFIGIKEAVRFRYGTDLKDIRVAIQGVGNVGFHLTRLLIDAGARVLVADVNRKRMNRAVDELGAQACALESIAGSQVEVLAPCALGGAINPQTVDGIRAEIVAGAANNQLANPAMGETLRQRGILYAPDYVINAGGIIDIYYQHKGVRDREHIVGHLDKIRSNLAAIFAASRDRGIATNLLADEMAEQVFRKPGDKDRAA